MLLTEEAMGFSVIHLHPVICFFFCLDSRIHARRTPRTPWRRACQSVQQSKSLGLTLERTGLRSDDGAPHFFFLVSFLCLSLFPLSRPPEADDDRMTWSSQTDNGNKPAKNEQKKKKKIWLPARRRKSNLVGLMVGTIYLAGRDHFGKLSVQTVMERGLGFSGGTCVWCGARLSLNAALSSVHIKIYLISNYICTLCCRNASRKAWTLIWRED